MLSDLIAKNYLIQYKVVTEEVFNRITELFETLFAETTKEFLSDIVEILYEIRIGNETYSGPSFKEFNKQYKKHYSAHFIRITIQATSVAKQLNPVNAHIMLTIDKKGNNSFSVLGQNANWVNGVFNRFKEILEKERNKNRIVNSIFYEMGVQLIAVLAMTFCAIYAADKLTSFISLEYSSVYIFVIIFLLLSNFWTYGSQGLISMRDKYYPKVDVIRKPRKQIMLTIVSFIGIATAYWVINYILDIIFMK